MKSGWHVKSSVLGRNRAVGSILYKDSDTAGDQWAGECRVRRRRTRCPPTDRDTLL